MNYVYDIFMGTFFKLKNKILIKIIAICMLAHTPSNQLSNEPLYNLMIYFV